MEKNLAESFSEMLMNVVEELLKSAKSEEDVKGIIKKIESFRYEEMFREYLDDIAESTLLDMKRTMHKNVMEFRLRDNEFLARHEQKWCNGFVASEALYIMALDASEHYNEYIKSLSEEETKDKGYTYTVFRYIHGRALQQFYEIIALIKNGFADGAFARWRSMYELSVIMAFIEKGGEKVAKSFFESSETNDRYEWAREYKDLKDKKGYITFSDIQKKSDLDSEVWKEQYNLANMAVHASPQGTFGRLCDMGDVPCIPVGRSDYGVTIAAEHSAISLNQISAMYFSLFPESDTIVYMKNMHSWTDVIRETYFKIHDEVFPDDEPLWKAISTDDE